ncbi:MAG: hypothetical protein V3U43_10825 [Pseudomonadales bacterium]
MPKLGTASLEGASGTTYTFNVYTKDTLVNDFIPGVYYLSRRSEDGDESPVYVGESDNIFRHVADHEKQSCFDDHAYNAIAIYRTANAEKRHAAQQDLIKALQPPCND